MNKLAMIILVVLMTGTSCETFRPINKSMDDSLLMTVDCMNETGLRQSIVMLMRSNWARDVTATPNGKMMTIKAVFLKRELILGKLNQLTADIENLGGVIELTVEENRGTVLQVLDRVPLTDR